MVREGTGGGGGEDGERGRGGEREGGEGVESEWPHRLPSYSLLSE